MNICSSAKKTCAHLTFPFGEKSIAADKQWFGDPLAFFFSDSYKNTRVFNFSTFSSFISIYHVSQTELMPCFPESTISLISIIVPVHTPDICCTCISHVMQINAREKRLGQNSRARSINLLSFFFFLHETLPFPARITSHYFLQLGKVKLHPRFGTFNMCFLISRFAPSFFFFRFSLIRLKKMVHLSFSQVSFWNLGFLITILLLGVLSRK